jgi:hypothetical protein
VGERMFQLGHFYHVTREHRFKNEYLFYRFAGCEYWQTPGGCVDY